MGFDVSATHTVFFITAVVVAVGVAGGLQQSASKLAGGINEHGEALHEELTSAIRIINDAADVPDDPVVLYVLNTGSRTLTPSETVVMIDGVPQNNPSFDVLGTASEDWRPGDVVEITLPGTNLNAGDHRAKVIAEYGAEHTLRFRAT